MGLQILYNDVNLTQQEVDVLSVLKVDKRIHFLTVVYLLSYQCNWDIYENEIDDGLGCAVANDIKTILERLESKGSVAKSGRDMWNLTGSR